MFACGLEDGKREGPNVRYMTERGSASIACPIASEVFTQKTVENAVHTTKREVTDRGNTGHCAYTAGAAPRININAATTKYTCVLRNKNSLQVGHTGMKKIDSHFAPYLCFP